MRGLEIDQARLAPLRSAMVSRKRAATASWIC